MSEGEASSMLNNDSIRSFANSPFWTFQTIRQRMPKKLRHSFLNHDCNILLQFIFVWWCIPRTKIQSKSMTVGKMTRWNYSKKLSSPPSFFTSFLAYLPRFSKRCRRGGSWGSYRTCGIPRCLLLPFALQPYEATVRLGRSLSQRLSSPSSQLSYYEAASCNFSCEHRNQGALQLLQSCLWSRLQRIWMWTLFLF